MKKVAIIVLLIAAAVLGLKFLDKEETKAPAPGESSSVAGIEARTYGTGPVELVEFADFQCPGCASFYPVVKQLKETYKDKISFKFKNFPLQTIHPNARAAHRAAQAAANQGKFWEMHDLLYENQNSWSQSTSAASTFETYASQLSLDMERYKADVASSATNDAINVDIEEGGKLNVTGTPTFFLEGKEINIRDIDTVEKFSKLLDDAYNAKTNNQQ